MIVWSYEWFSALNVRKCEKIEHVFLFSTRIDIRFVVYVIHLLSADKHTHLLNEHFYIEQLLCCFITKDGANVNIF